MHSTHIHTHTHTPCMALGHSQRWKTKRRSVDRHKSHKNAQQCCVLNEPRNDFLFSSLNLIFQVLSVECSVGGLKITFFLLRSLALLIIFQHSLLHFTHFIRLFHMKSELIELRLCNSFLSLFKQSINPSKQVH